MTHSLSPVISEEIKSCHGSYFLEIKCSFVQSKVRALTVQVVFRYHRSVNKVEKLTENLTVVSGALAVRRLRYVVQRATELKFFYF